MIALQIVSIISSLVLLTLSIINIAQIISNHKKMAKRMEELRVLQKAYEEEIASHLHIVLFKFKNTQYIAFSILEKIVPIPYPMMKFV